MMTHPLTRPTMRLSAFFAALALTVPALAQQPEPGSARDQQVRVQITEVGLLRTLLLVSADSRELETRIRKKFTDRDFEVYTDTNKPEGNVTSAQMRAAGESENADLIVYARISEDRQRSEASGMKLWEATAAVQLYNRVTGQELATEEVRERGIRHPDVVDARRSAREKAIDAATTQAIELLLSKAHRMMVFHATLVGVYTEGQLLGIMDYIAGMQDPADFDKAGPDKRRLVYHVRRLSFDREKNEAQVEIIGSPRASTFWREYLEKMPRTEVNVQVTPNDGLRNHYPDFFQPPAN